MRDEDFLTMKYAKVGPDGCCVLKLSLLAVGNEFIFRSARRRGIVYVF